MGKRERTSERKEEILRISAEIIHNQGFYKLTIRNIAKRIFISEAAIYRHFQSKEEIISELCRKVFSKNQYWFEDVSKEDPRKLLTKIMLNQLKILKEEPYLSTIMFQEEIFREYPVLREYIKEHRERNENTIKNIIIKGQKEDIFHRNITPSVFAILFMGGIRMLVTKWRQGNFNIPIEEEATKVIDQLLQFIQRCDK